MGVTEAQVNFTSLVIDHKVQRADSVNVNCSCINQMLALNERWNSKPGRQCWSII